MLSLQELSDRTEIQSLAITYANAIDRRAFDRLDGVFTPDAYIDYRAMGGVDGKYPQIKSWLKEALVASRFPAYQHMIGNHEIHISGDKASGRVLCFNPMVVAQGEGKTQVAFLGLWYADEYVRTPTGWRIADRREEQGYVHNYPGPLQSDVKIS